MDNFWLIDIDVAKIGKDVEKTISPDFMKELGIIGLKNMVGM